MRVSVVTPSFNQGKYLEETIRSVLEQSYPEIEYIIIDGGSRDQSLDIIRKYENRLAYWQTGKDRNAWDAINQGWEKSTGEIFCYLNADDVFLENTVQTIVEKFQQNPNVDVLYGDATAIDSNGKQLFPFASENFDIAKIFRTWEDPIRQPSSFFRASVFKQYGGTDETYPFCADFEYWIRIAPTSKFLYIPLNLSLVRLHAETRTATMEDVQARELIRLAKQFIDTQQFHDSGVQPKEALSGAYLRAMMHFRNAGHKLEALKSYFHYCRLALPPVYGLYRFSRFCASLLIK